MLDLTVLDILYHSIIQCRPPSTADLMVIVVTESVPSTMPVMKQTESQPQPSSKPVSIPPVFWLSYYQSGGDYQPSSPTLIVEPVSSTTITDHASSVSNMLISMEAPSRLTAFYAPLMTALVTPLMIITTKLIETSPSRITYSLWVIEVEKEFVVELVNRFFMNQSQCLSLVLTGSKTSFKFLKVVLSPVISL